MKVGDLVVYNCATYFNNLHRPDGEVGIVLRVERKGAATTLISVHFPFNARAGTQWCPPCKLKVLSRSGEKIS